MKEIWKDIPNYQGYQVSNLGNVRTHNKVTSSALHSHRAWKDRIMKGRGDNKVTGKRVSLWKDGKGKDFLVARLVAFTFYEKDIDDHSLTVDHIDGNRLNNKLDNLELVSLKENIQRGFKTGLYPTKKVVVVNKKNGEKKTYNSMSEASKNVGKNVGYISGKLLKGKNSNEDYLFYA